ncbi:MAG: S9 family peptidase [Sphingomonadaceae bacterium]|nr:S9 family peptidase [Sphingomonadaceae bacterium]
MLTAVAALALCPAITLAQAAEPSAQSRSFKAIDLFALEYAADPQISPDGKKIAYVRRSFDIMTDRARANIWIVDVATGEHRPLLSGASNFSSPRWSPDGKGLAYVSSAEGSAQIYVRWMDSGATARVTNLTNGPAGLSWSPDGRQLAFAMFVPEDAKPFASMPATPQSARWAGKPVVIDRLNYRNDGAGYAAQGHDHIFTVPAEGGTPRQVTTGAFDHGGRIDWSNDSKTLVFSANRKDDPDRHPQRDQIFSITLETGALIQLTKREGPSVAPQISPDGKMIAFLGYTDRYTSNQEFSLWVMNRDGSNARALTASMDVGVTDFGWDNRGNVLASGLGGEDIGRPYSGISMSIARDGTVATNVTSDTHPGDVAVIKGTNLRRLTRLNDDVAAIRDLARVEEIWTTAADGVKSQSWIMKPANFDPSKKYPMILEIHGGPHTNYGARFSAEMQAYAAAGYVVLYSNPRGSTSYGDKFANMIDKAYPGGDYGDLMAAVDGLLSKGYVDPARLFVTGGSGGGVLTAWIVGNTNRFRAAVVAKPVINWTSFALTADNPSYFGRYWFGKNPWEAGAQAEYWRRSPLSLVGNVKTPTMLITGEQDYRTPISETEQYYTALKLNGVETAQVRIPDSSHGMIDRPSRLVAKTTYILGWFAKHGGVAADTGQ